MFKYFVIIYKVCYQINLTFYFLKVVNQVISLPVSYIFIFHIYVAMICPIKNSSVFLMLFVCRIVANVQNKVCENMIVLHHDPDNMFSWAAVITSKEKTKTY